MQFELGIQVWKIMSFRWRPSSWMQFSILHLKSSIARPNSCWSIVSNSCHMASLNSSNYGVCECTHGPSGTPSTTLRSHQWTFFKTYSLGASFRVSAMCHGPQDLLTCHHVISSSGGTWRAVCTLTNPIIWTRWRMPSGKKCSRIDQQLLAQAMDDFKRRIENCIQEDGRHRNDIIFHTWIPNLNSMSWPLIL